MEKIVFIVWRHPNELSAAFNRKLLDALGPALHETGATRVKVCVTDEAVAPGEPMRRATQEPAPCGLVSFWLNSAHMVAPQAALVESFCSRSAGFAVAESVALPNLDQASRDERCSGFNQIALFAKPQTMPRHEWLENWLNHHTAIAIQTQSNYYYCQNIVTRPLTHNAPYWHAIVEEAFPMDALTDRTLFFAARDDAGLFRENVQTMMTSCASFMDSKRVDVLITSEYRLGSWRDLQHANLAFLE